MLRLVLGRDWTANREAILRRIARDIAEKQGGRILLVPELISHETERLLCRYGGDTASRYAEVLSFTRLARRVSDTMGSTVRECLDNGGRVVAMAAAARQLSSRLKAYAAVETKPEFLTGMIDAVDEFKRCCITSRDLADAAAQTEGSLAQKLEELSLLMETYDSLCSRGKRDPRDQMTWLLEQLEMGTFGQEHVFYIDGFPDFTRQNFAILAHLIQVCPSITISLNCDQPGSGLLAFEKAGETARELIQCAQRSGVAVQVEVIPEGEGPLKTMRERIFQGSILPVAGCLHTYRGKTPYHACLDAAKRIRTLVAQGCRYRDIALVCTDLSLYQPLVDLTFHRFHIPLYRTGTQQILEKNVIYTVLTALDAALGGFDQRETLEYLRSALSPLSMDLCDEIENYAILWGIRGQAWVTPWENHPEGLGGVWTEEDRRRLAVWNEAREETMGPLERLRRGFREASDLKDQVLALYAFLEEIHLERRLSDLARELDDAGENREAQILNQLWEILLTALEQMYDVLGQTHWEPEQFVRLLRLLLSQYDVGTIPPVLDAVQMGPVSAMRCNQQKHLFVLGAEEGNLPGYSGSAGVLTDQERTTLRGLGVPLTGGAMEGIQAEFAEIYGVFSGAEECVHVYCSDEQPSFVFRRLVQMTGVEEEADGSLGFAQADAWEAGACLARWNAAEEAARLGMQEAYEDTCRRRDFSLGKVTPDHIRGLYGQTLQLSASQIDRQAECRMSYFLRYGLRAKERKEAAVDPAEFGTYVHAVLENTARCVRDAGGFHQVSLEQTMELAHRFSEEYAKERFSQIASERMRYLFRRNLRELDMVVKELWTELRESAFEPVDFEVSFGAGEGLPPIAIPNRGMDAIVRGFVDRMDTWKTGPNTYFRVVDYKTGKKDFDYCDVFNGVGLQMLLYLFALRDSGHGALGDRPIPAGVQYFPARAPYLSADGKLTLDQAEDARKDQWKRRGLLLSDQGVLQAMEPGDNPKRLCYTQRKDGTLSGDLADREQMKGLEEYIFHILARTVEDIASGEVQPNPYTRGTSHNACAFCPYGQICHEKTVEGRRNYKAMTAQRFWEEIEKEMKHHGG